MPSKYVFLERSAQNYEVVADGRLSSVVKTGKQAAAAISRLADAGDFDLLQVVDTDSGEVMYDSSASSDAGLKPAAALAALKKSK